ncbi:hypothetical protein E2320_008160, partial [Naja naja]
ALGTPNNDVWPEVESLQDYKNTFPKWKPSSLASHKMLIYDPAKRISGRMALTHPYFDDLDKSKLPANRLKKC